jgi:glycosyltransferase involved in cell wall biosynthesis
VADPKFRRVRVLHLVSGDGQSTPNPMLVPLLARGNRQRIESQVVTFTIGDARYSVVRQSGLPVHEVALSRQRFSFGAISDAKKIVNEFKPDVLHAWGSTAHIIASRFLAKRGKGTIPIVWGVSRTTPLDKKSGWLDKQKFAQNQKLARHCERIIYPSAVAAANYRRGGMPDELGMIVSPGVDAERFKPDEAARERVRKQLELPKEAVLVGMYAPFSPEFDHGTFVKAIGELTRINHNLYCVLAGRGTVKGNAALTAMIGGGALATRSRIVGEWTDISALFNACDIVCSSAQTDNMRMSLAISMLCGTMCCATGVGAQGEVLGSFGATVEPGSVDAMVRGIRRILEMPTERKAFMAQAARNHILQNFNATRSIEKFHELYIELATGQAAAVSTDAREVESKDTAQNKAAADVIAARAQSISSNLNKPAPTPTKEEPQEEASPSCFGSVAAPALPAFTAFAKNLDAALFAATGEASQKTPATPMQVPLTSEMATSESAANAKDHWTDDDSSLMDNILVEADPETARATADKAAKAAQSAAQKAATNAALAAALSGNPDAAKTMDPKMLAAALNMSGAGRAAPRAVAGKPPPAPNMNKPAASAAAPSPAVSPSVPPAANAAAPNNVTPIRVIK